MRTALLLFSLVLLAPHAARAQASDTGRLPVGDVRTLMVAAIDARDGTARGILTGIDSQNITKLFQATGPILVDVTTVKRYSEAGCSRLRVLFSQDGVRVDEKGPPSRKQVAFGINFCRDGNPPKSLT
jgi:hypothetical protein